jgi:hypothetical protein
MTTDARSSNRNYPIPDEDNLISEDFPRLRSALVAIDADVHGLLSSVAARALLLHSHAISDVTGLAAALASKQSVSWRPALGELADVVTTGTATGHFLRRGASGWQSVAVGPGDVGAFPASSVSSFGASLIDDADAAAARATLGLGSSALTSDDRVAYGNANASIAANARVVAINAALTAPRTLTLPAANAPGAPPYIIIVDEARGVSAANPLSIQRAGSDTINGVATPVVLDTAGAAVILTRNGSANWTAINTGGSAAFTGTSLAAISVGTEVQAIQTVGYAIVGDGGGALYRRVATQPSHAGKVQSADGAWWEIADNVLHVKQFGAVDNGSTRADLAINAALSTAFATGRAKVLITGNTYHCIGQIVLRAGVALVGDKKATLRFGNNNNLTVPVTGDTFGPGATAHGASLIDLVIDGNRANNAAARETVLTHLYAADNVIVRGCVFKNAPGHTLCFAGFNCIIEDNLIENRRIQGIWFTGRPDTATNFNVNAIIRRNRISGAGAGSLYIYGMHNSLITENVIESPIIGLRNSVKVSTNGTAVTLNSTQVAGDNFLLFGPGAILTLNGGQEYEVETVNSATSLTVTSPIPTLNNVSAVLGSADGIGICASRRLVISNNRIRGVATFGMATSVAGPVLQSDVDIVGNMISDTGKVGISIAGDALAVQQRIAIRDNFLINTGTGADAVGEPWDKTGITVYPVGAGSLSDIFIDGNTIRSDAGVGMTKYWLAIEPSAAPGTVILGENTSTTGFGSSILNEGSRAVTLGRSTFVGDVGVQQTLHRYGFSNGTTRAATVLEDTGAFSTFFYNADATAITGTFTLAPDGQASSFGLGAYWHTGNFGRPTGAAGVGQFVFVNPGVGQGYTLPAGGTWAYFWAYYTTSGEFVTSFAGIVAGGAGTNGGAGEIIQGFAWRIS